MSNLKTYDSLVTPKLVDSQISDCGNIASFCISPLERGMGMTMGVALRRTILSCICGVAVKSVKIADVEHEFSVIPGVKEDVMTVCLNLKNVVFKTDLEEFTATLNVAGHKKIKASMIDVPEGVEVVNSDCYLFEISDDHNVSIELDVCAGTGYSLNSENTLSYNNGKISLDCIFSPIKNTKFSVEEMMYDNESTHDKLVVDITTNGSILAENVFDQACAILRDFFDNITKVKESLAISRIESEKKSSVAEYNTHLFKSVNELDLSVRCQNCLNHLKVSHVYELVQCTEQDCQRVPNCGKKTLTEIKKKLGVLNLSLGMDLGKDKVWPPENLDELVAKAQNTNNSIN